jgi:hypothetical protein
MIPTSKGKADDMSGGFLFTYHKLNLRLNGIDERSSLTILLPRNSLFLQEPNFGSTLPFN